MPQMFPVFMFTLMLAIVFICIIYMIRLFWQWPNEILMKTFVNKSESHKALTFNQSW